MKRSSIRSNAARHQPHTFFSSLRSALSAGVAVAAMIAAAMGARAQTPAPDAAAPSAAPPAATAPAASAPATQQPPQINLTNQPASGKTRKQKEERVVQSKDTVKEDKKYKKDNPLEGMDAMLPDKQLYDKAEDAVKHGHFDVARLDLQTLLNTYPDSQFQMRAKLAIADSWYKEGGTAALTQAEQEYRDFITFFPNAPEAAEAQMRIGDIYFREMDKPDRDHSKAIHAQEEYRLMLQQFPDSPRVAEAAQRLREVQEYLAGAESDVAGFYATRQNWAAAIARYQTVVETYPLYSHMDDVLVGLGDAYEAEANYYRTVKAPIPEAARARLVKIDDDQAARAYRQVVLEHSAAPHVEDARDRLAAMGLPIPTPTPEQVAASEALENSRGQYTLSKRVEFFVMRKADTVPAATLGAPPLEDPKPVLAPTVTAQFMKDFQTAMNPANNTSPSNAAAPALPAAPASAEAAQAPTTVAAAPLQLQDVAPVEGATPSASAAVAVPSAANVPAGGGTSIGMEIVQPSADSPAPVTPPGTSATAFPGTQDTQSATPVSAAQTSDPALNLAPASSSAPLPPVERAAPAPDAVNDIVPGSQRPAQAQPANGKPVKATCDKTDESCTGHKKKKGLAKLNPF